MSEYKEQIENQNKIPILLHSSEDIDISSEYALKELLQTVKSITDPNSESSNILFDRLKSILNHKDFHVDPSTFVNSGFLKYLVEILFKETDCWHFKTISIINYISKYKEVLQALNNPEIISFFFDEVLIPGKDIADVEVAFEILSRIVPYVPEEEVLSFPIKNFIKLGCPEISIPFLSDLIEYHPSKLLFHRIMNLIHFNIRRYYQKLPYVIKILKKILSIYPGEIIFVSELSLIGFESKKFIHNIYILIPPEDYENMSRLMESFHEPLVQQINDADGMFDVIEKGLLRKACTSFFESSCILRYKSVFIKFMSDCAINTRSRMLTYNCFKDWYFSYLFQNYCSSEYDFAMPALTIIAYYIDCHGYKEADMTVRCHILDKINDIIPCNIEIAILLLNVILKKYLQNKQNDRIVDFINKTEIIQKLREVKDTDDIGTDNNKLIANFLDKFNDIPTFIKKR